MPRRLAYGIGIVLGVGVAVNAVLYLWWVTAAVTIPYQFNYVEGFILYFAAEPSTMYQPITSPPYFTVSYPPLYMYLVATSSRVVGDSFLAGRLLTILAAVSTAVFIAKIVAHRGGGRIAAGIAGMLFVLSPVVYALYGLYIKPDMLAVGFGVAALYWYVTTDGSRLLVGCTVLSLLALYTKQTAFAAPATIALSLALRGELRQAVTFAGVLGGTGLALLWGLNQHTSGQAWLHLVTYNQHAYLPGQAVELLGQFAALHFPLLLLVGYLYRRDSGFEPCPQLYRDATIFLVLGGLITLFSGKAGSSMNFMLELLAALALFAGIAVAKLEWPSLRTQLSRQPDSGRVVTTAVVVLLLLSAQMGLYAVGGLALTTGTFVKQQGPFEGVREADSSIDWQTVDGPILSEDAGLLVRHEQSVTYEPFNMRQLSEQGTWSEAPVLSNIRSQRYEYVILYFNVSDPAAWDTARWTPSELRMIDTHYCLEARSGTYWIYVPDTQC